MVATVNGSGYWIQLDAGRMLVLDESGFWCVLDESDFLCWVDLRAGLRFIYYKPAQSSKELFDQKHPSVTGTIQKRLTMAGSLQRIKLIEWRLAHRLVQ